MKKSAPQVLDSVNLALTDYEEQKQEDWYMPCPSDSGDDKENSHLLAITFPPKNTYYTLHFWWWMKFRWESKIALSHFFLPEWWCITFLNLGDKNNQPMMPPLPPPLHTGDQPPVKERKIIMVMSQRSQYRGQVGFIYKMHSSGWIGVMLDGGIKLTHTQDSLFSCIGPYIHTDHRELRLIGPAYDRA